MVDRYDCFAALAAQEIEDVHYRIRIAARPSPIAVLAPHGGLIEPGTSEATLAIAEDVFSFYCFESLTLRARGDGLHITSTHFDEPQALQLVRECDVAIGVHGRKNGADAASIWVGGLQAIGGSLTLGQIVAFTNYLITTMTPLIMMTQLSNTWANGIASAHRINEVLDTVPEVQEDPQALPLPAGAAGRVTFQNVTFHYNGSTDVSVLEGINLVAEPGKTIAILGATGAGKSSLVNLVPRFYDASSGQVAVDGMDVRHIRSESLLGQVGIVPQESVLFLGMIAENIRYGRPEASLDEVIAAAQAAQAHEFIQVERRRT